MARDYRRREIGSYRPHTFEGWETGAGCKTSKLAAFHYAQHGHTAKLMGSGQDRQEELAII